MSFLKKMNRLSLLWVRLKPILLNLLKKQLIKDGTVPDSGAGDASGSEEIVE